MKRLFAATAMLTVVCAAAHAQAGDNKTNRADFKEAFNPEARCDSGAGRFDGLDCRPPSSRSDARHRRLFQSGPPSELPQKPPGADGHATGNAPGVLDEAPEAGGGFRWGPAFKQSLLFLSVQHGYALTQQKTRRALHGPFLRDYFQSMRSLRGWADGGRFFTNYVAHPMQGSLLGFIQVQNDPAGSRLKFKDPGYWRSRMKALAWSAAWSTQFEIGPVSQASIGNVGLHGKQTYVDIVMTPTAGTALLVAEDALDKYLIERIERRTDGKYARIFARMALNPTRTAANLLRFKKPWHRDEGLR